LLLQVLLFWLLQQFLFLFLDRSFCSRNGEKMITFYLVTMTLFFLAAAGFNFSENKNFDVGLCFFFGMWPLFILAARFA